MYYKMCINLLFLWKLSTYYYNYVIKKIKITVLSNLVIT